MSPWPPKGILIIVIECSCLHRGLFIPDTIGGDPAPYGDLAPAGEFLDGEVPKWGIRPLAVERSEPERCIIRVRMEVQ